MHLSRGILRQVLLEARVFNAGVTLQVRVSIHDETWQTGAIMFMVRPTINPVFDAEKGKQQGNLCGNRPNSAIA